MTNPALRPSVCVSAPAIILGTMACANSSYSEDTRHTMFPPITYQRPSLTRKDVQPFGFAWKVHDQGQLGLKYLNSALWTPRTGTRHRRRATRPVCPNYNQPRDDHRGVAQVSISWCIFLRCTLLTSFGRLGLRHFVMYVWSSLFREWGHTSTGWVLATHPEQRTAEQERDAGVAKSTAAYAGLTSKSRRWTISRHVHRLDDILRGLDDA